MYEHILVPLDNSPFSEACCAAAVSLAQASGAEVVGAHVYAAKMHERRFRQMEATLPEEYMVDEELERQRVIHESLIGLGLQLISDCYLDALEQRCREAEVHYSRKSLEGKNWERLVEDINDSDYDLVIMGARGHGTDRADTLGSVAMRVLRRIQTDALVIKQPEVFADGIGKPIVVALDGSQEAFGALQTAVALGKVYDKRVEVIAAFDPYFHYAVFHSMVEVLSEKAARLFRFKEQEQLHEEIIDNGLAHLYQAHLEVGQRMAESEGVSLTTTLLTGRAADELLTYAEKAQPWMLLLGRIGVHSSREMDIGSVTEHILRFAPCNILVSSNRLSPPIDMWSDSTLRWTAEAETALKRVPEEFRGAMRLMVQQLALKQGHTVITASLLGEAGEAMRPPRQDTSRMEEAALSVAVEALRKEAQTVYICRGCGYAARGQRPVACPVCRKEGETFLTVDPDVLEAAVQEQGGSQSEETFDGRSLRWARAALDRLQQIPDPDRRSRARLRIEKAARSGRMPVVTLEFVIRHLPEVVQMRGVDGGA